MKRLVKTVLHQEAGKEGVRLQRETQNQQNQLINVGGGCYCMIEVNVMLWWRWMSWDEGGWVSWDDGSECDGMMGVDVMELVKVDVMG